MIRAGDSLVNPATGERLVFHKTSRETGGGSCLVEAFLEPRGFVSRAHVHPYQSETLVALDGTLSLKAGRDRIDLAPGCSITILAGTPHRVWNASDETIRFARDVRPALAFESLVETMFGLAADNQTNAQGRPSLLQLAVIANHHFDDVRLAVVPHRLQKAALALAAPIGRALGYRPTYETGARELALV